MTAKKRTGARIREQSAPRLGRNESGPMAKCGLCGKEYRSTEGRQHRQAHVENGELEVKLVLTTNQKNEPVWREMYSRPE